MRFPHEMQARCYGIGRGEGIECTVTEISRQGIVISITAEKISTQGSYLVLDIDHPELSKPMQALIRLKWSKASSNGKQQLTVGGKICILEQTDTESLLSAAYNLIIKTECN